MNIATSKLKRKAEIIPLIIPFSKNAKTAPDIVNHHFQILKQELPDVSEHQNDHGIYADIIWKANLSEAYSLHGPNN